ncbi:MAG: hypothetical protein COB46_02085 [Rhodospirillaceae bacterium]|nr:MAG: hypothetical protein COB46_02085 [Rhodospirillaceae bacterium]
MQLSELTRIEERFGSIGVQKYRHAANTLLRFQFVFSGDRGRASTLETLSNPIYYRALEVMFDALGYTLIKEDQEQWAGILPDTEDLNLPKISIENTIVLLVLSIVWQEQIQKGDGDARAIILVSYNEFFERYRDLVARSRKEHINDPAMRQILRTEFQPRGIIRLSDLDADNDDFDLEIRPIVSRLTPEHVLKKLESYVNIEEVKLPHESISNPENLAQDNEVNDD